jgi:PIN domain nuclease of toxin-antitoxin system
VNDPDVVADASAVLALLKDEELGEFDPEHLVGAAISAVNFSEVLAKLGSGGLTEAEADAAAAALDLHVIAFDEHQVRSAARLSSAARRFGLSPKTAPAWRWVFASADPLSRPTGRGESSTSTSRSSRSGKGPALRQSA